MSKDFNYQITRPVAVLSRSNNGRYTAEVNYISYNGDEPKLDIRKWDRENNKILKGIALNKAEAEALKEALLGGMEP